MTAEVADETKVKKERSPSYPFISLEKAVIRAKAMEEKHKREPSRLPVVGATWGYAPKSSGLAQTVGALIQFGLLDDIGANIDRKIQLTDLARRIMFDTRPGVREQGLKDAALKPRIIAECFGKWGEDRPSDDHCVSELIFDRGFNDVGARLFLKNYDETVTFAGLKKSDSLSSILTEDNLPAQHANTAPEAPSPLVSAVAAQMTPAPRRVIDATGFVPKRSTFALSEGIAAVELPDKISTASIQDLADWFELLLKRARREAEAAVVERPPGISDEAWALMKEHGLV